MFIMSVSIIKKLNDDEYVFLQKCLIAAHSSQGEQLNCDDINIKKYKITKDEENSLYILKRKTTDYEYFINVKNQHNYNLCDTEIILSIFVVNEDTFVINCDDKKTKEVHEIYEQNEKDKKESLEKKKKKNAPKDVAGC